MKVRSICPKTRMLGPAGDAPTTKSGAKSETTAPLPAAGNGAVVSLFAPDFVVGASPAGPSMRVLGQIDRTFILASDGKAILLVDQHAAHERIAYEAIVAAAETHAPSEPLLVPQ